MKAKELDARELRIGNLVYYHLEDNLDERKEWDEISTIDALDLLALSQIAIAQKDNQNYRPIPLSEEILIKAGFELYENTYWRLKRTHFKLTRFCTLTAIQPDRILFICEQATCELKYVHQLQNLYFALTGEELELQQ